MSVCPSGCWFACFTLSWQKVNDDVFKTMPTIIGHPSSYLTSLHLVSNAPRNHSFGHVTSHTAIHPSIISSSIRAFVLLAFINLSIHPSIHLLTTKPLNLWLRQLTLCWLLGPLPPTLCLSLHGSGCYGHLFDFILFSFFSLIPSLDLIVLFQ